MAEEKVFKNVKLDKSGPNWFVDYSPFHENEWDVEIKLTRKVKPIPDRTKAVSETLGPFYYKKNGVWYYYLHPGDRDATKAVHQDDEWYRTNTKPLKAGEWD